jgi:hypothetical protein
VERDAKVVELVLAMDDCYELIETVKGREELEHHRRRLERLSQQTVECGYFISSYAHNQSFGV